MMELIKNARIGWMDYTESGKLAALLLLALLWFWFAQKEHRNRYLTLILYTTGMTICCICPLTAAVLMTYQTRFYDYQWIWSMVPITIVIALAGTLLWFTLTGEYARGRGRRWKSLGITSVMLAVIYLCGPMLRSIPDTQEVASGQAETARVLEVLLEDGEDTEITIWAPRMIMENVRTLNGSVRMPYGRNMWDPALNAYSYDAYGETEKLLYEWMCGAEETGEGQLAMDAQKASSGTATVSAAGTTAGIAAVTATECVGLAEQLGVTHILLPDTLKPEVLAEIESYLEVKARTVEGYYLLEL